MEIEIREERPQDYYEVEHMVMRAFWNIHCPGCNEHLLVRVIRKSPDYLPQFTRLAVVDGKIVGAIYFSIARVIDGEKVNEVVTFGPLAVEPTFQNGGIGKALMDATFKLVKEAGYPGIIIFGEKDYYPKYGFEKCKKYGLTDTEGNCWDSMMAYPFDKEAFSQIKGVFYESPSFEEADDEASLAAISKEFPEYEKIKLYEGFQMLNSGRIGKVLKIDGDNYTVKFWELLIVCKIEAGVTLSKAPEVGDVVIFEYRKAGESAITKVCEVLN